MGEWKLVHADSYSLVLEPVTEKINLTINLIDSQHNMKIKSIGNYDKVVTFIEQK